MDFSNFLKLQIFLLEKQVSNYEYSSIFVRQNAVLT